MTNSQAYSHKDFEQNPGKYKLFRTARIAETISGSPRLKVGSFVQIQYYATQHNGARGVNVDMPIYLTWMAGDSVSLVAPHMLFACALEGFCL